MRVLVTGADGFVGRHLVRRLLKEGHQVGAACRPGGPSVGWEGGAVTPLSLELTDHASVAATVDYGPDAVVHLAAVASTSEARADPGKAWEVNAAGTARLAEALATRERSAEPALLVVSSGEVYGPGGPVPRVETDPVQPLSAYAASKVGAEIAGLEVWRRTGLRVIIARAFTHTGPGQQPRFVLPAFVRRLRAAKAAGVCEVPTGNIDPVRDLLDVRDVVAAYLALLRTGAPGEIYNVARGEGWPLRELFARLAELIGVSAVPVPDPELTRAKDLPHLVGDSTKLRRTSGWTPTHTLEQTLQGLVDAEAE